MASTFFENLVLQWGKPLIALGITINGNTKKQSTEELLNEVFFMNNANVQNSLAFA